MDPSKQYLKFKQVLYLRKIKKKIKQDFAVHIFFICQEGTKLHLARKDV